MLYILQKDSWNNLIFRRKHSKQWWGLTFPVRPKNEMLNSPMEKGTVTEKNETGSQNWGSNPCPIRTLYTRFIHSFVLPTQSTKFWNNYHIISISKDWILHQTSWFSMMPTIMFMYNVLQERNFWPKTIRLTNAGTYNINHWFDHVRLSTSLKLKRISLQEYYYEFYEDTQSNVITILKPLSEHDCQQCFYTW